MTSKDLFEEYHLMGQLAKGKLGRM